MLKARPSDRPPVQKNNKYKKQSNIISKSLTFKKGVLKKYLLRILSVFSVLLIVAIFIGPKFVNLRVWKPEIVLMLEELTNRKASLEGDINLSIFPFPEVTITDIKLMEMDGEEYIDFLTFEEIRAKLTIWPLIKGKIVIEKVELNGFKLTLQDRKDGTPNWFSGNKKHDALHNIDSENNLIHSSESSDKTTDPNSITFADIEIKEYKFSKGIIIINNNIASFNLGVEEFTILPISQNNNLLIGILNILDHEINVNSNFSNSSDEGNLWDGSASFRHDDLYVNMDLSVEYKEFYPYVKGKFSGNSENLKNFLEAIKVKSFLGLNTEVPLKTEGKIDISINKDMLIYEVEDFFLGLGSTNLTGVINGKSGVNPVMDVALSSNSIDLDTNRSDFSNYLLSLKEDLNEKTIDKAEFKKKNYWEKLNGSILLSVGTAKLYNYPIRDIVLDLNKDAENFKIKNISAVFPGNTNIILNGNFGTEFDVFKGDVKFETQDFRSYAKWSSFNKIDFIPSNRFRALNFYSNLVVRPGAATFAGLKGKFDATIFDGEMRFRWGDKNNISSTINLDSINFDIYKFNINNDKKNSSQTNIPQEDKRQEFNYKEIFKDETDLNLNIYIRNAVLYGKKINGLRYLGNISKNFVKIEDISIDSIEGLKLLGKGEVKMSGSSPNLDIKLKINSNSNNLENFFNFSDKTKRFLSGQLISNLKLKGKLSDLDAEINAKVSDLHIQYAGNMTIEDFKLSELNGKINLEHKTIGKFFADNIGITKKFYNGLGKFSSKVYSNKDTLDLKDIIFSNKEIEYKGSAKIIYDNDKLNFESSINGNFIRMNDLLLFLDYFNLTKIVNKNNKEKNNLLGSLRLKLDNFLVYGSELKAVKIHSNFRPESIEINKFNANIYKGSVSFDSSISPGKIIKSNSNISLTGIDVQSFNKDIFGWNFVEGNFTLDLKLESELNNINKTIKVLDGKGKLDVTNLNIKGFNPNLINDITFDNNRKEIDKIIKDSYSNGVHSIKNFSSNIKIKDNKILFDKIPLYFDKIDADLTGNIDFLDKNTEIALNFNMNNEKAINIGLIYTGSWDRIKKSVLIHRSLEDNTKNENPVSVEENISVINDPINEQEKIQDIKKEIIKDKSIEEDNVIKNDRKLVVNIDKIINDMELPSPLKTKIISNPKYFQFTSGLQILNNDILKPRKPSQEELLDDVLDSILE